MINKIIAERNRLNQFGNNNHFSCKCGNIIIAETGDEITSDKFGFGIEGENYCGTCMYKYFVLKSTKYYYIYFDNSRFVVWKINQEKFAEINVFTHEISALHHHYYVKIITHKYYDFILGV